MGQEAEVARSAFIGAKGNPTVKMRATQRMRALASPHPPNCTVFLAVDAAHAEVFDFEEFLDAVFRAP
jgi:hypothetical protein